jgi:hypothetical protein
MGEKVIVQLEVSKETHELAVGLGKVVDAVKGALADGWQAGTDLPVVLTTVIADLIPAIQGVEKLKEEVVDVEQFAGALYAGIAPSVFKLIKK